jgi:hypothetical protein
LCTGDDKGGATKVLAAVCEADSAGADPRCGGTPGPFPGGGILTDATTVGRDAFQIAVILLGWVMQQQDKAEHYRKEANRCADLAKAAQLDFLREIYRKAAVRYALMAEEAERPAPVRAGGRREAVSLWDRAEQLLALTR